MAEETKVVALRHDPKIRNLSAKLWELIERDEFGGMTYESVIGVLENTKLKLQREQFEMYDRD